ncbi:MAG: DUF1049 domain-containing protein [Thioalkalivibrio sp.]|nr:DUF1049 domain-containing protein [Thioalkalivibrio sp.]
MMRYLHIALIVLFVAVIALFMLQNLDAATVSFLAVRLTMPLAVLIFLVYVLGMLTGGFAVALLRRSFYGASRKKSQES